MNNNHNAECTLRKKTKQLIQFDFARLETYEDRAAEVRH